ncbi:2126_t:CDS:2, partial [Diversispora eburnea]
MLQKRIPKTVGKVKDDSNNFFIISGTLDELVIFGTSDGNNSNKSYHFSSDELDYDTFVEIKKKINYTYDWFTRPGIKKSLLSYQYTDVSSLLLEYRDISLNYIFLFEQNVTIEISSIIEPESLNIIFDTIKNEFVPYHLSNDNIASEDFRKYKPLLRKWQKDLDDNQEDLILEMFESMQGLKEDFFVHEVFEPLTNILKVSVHRKCKFDLILQEQKVDFSVYLPIKGNEMKDIIDKCIDDGVKSNDLIIYNLLIE